MLWQTYYDSISDLNIPDIQLPKIPSYATNNGHMFYVVLQSIEQRTALIAKLKENGFHAVFHYLSLHASDFYREKHDGRALPNSDKFSDCLLRLPMFYELEEEVIKRISTLISNTK
jgi:dTDP-4-amino-4,6-dideoxygalactose transaminase